LLSIKETNFLSALSTSRVLILIVSPDLPVTILEYIVLLSELIVNLKEATKSAMIIKADQILLKAILEIILINK
jgi:hypothetical protein